MKLYTTLLTLSAGVSLGATAQTTIIDSIQTGPAYGNEVYYSLNNGLVKTSPVNEWNLAFSIGEFNVAVRANHTGNNSGDGSTTIYEMPGTDTSKWSNFDTTGYQGWDLLNNSDEDWENGALNQNSTGQFDYGWGKYNTSTHVVEGHRLYLAVIKSGSNTLYKKLIVLSKQAGNWAVRFANLDGTSSQTVSINSADYTARNFAYLSLVTGNLINREPDNETWDFVLQRYNAWQPAQQVYYPSVGIITNYGVKTSEVRGKDEQSTTLSDTTAFSSNISTIGADWKQLNMSTFAFDVVDSLTYFVQDINGAFWKLVFTKFLSGSNATTGTGRTVFAKTKLTPSTGIREIGQAVNNLSVYPNPASTYVQVLFNTQSQHNLIRITDLTGKVWLEKSVEYNGAMNNETISLDNLSNGLYFVTISNNSGVSTSKLVIE